MSYIPEPMRQHVVIDIPVSKHNVKCIHCMKQHSTPIDKMLSIKKCKDISKKSGCECNYYIHQHCYSMFKDTLEEGDANGKCPSCNKKIYLAEYTKKTCFVVPNVEISDIKHLHSGKNSYIVINKAPFLYRKIMNTQDEWIGDFTDIDNVDLQLAKKKQDDKDARIAELERLNDVTNKNFTNSVIVILVLMFVLLCIIVF